MPSTLITKSEAAKAICEMCAGKVEWVDPTAKQSLGHDYWEHQITAQGFEGSTTGCEASKIWNLQTPDRIVRKSNKGDCR